MDDKLNVAIYDFDGTLTTESSFIDFLKFYLEKKKALLKFIDNIPSCFGATPTSIKEKIFSLFFKGMDVETYNKLCEDFCKNRLSTIIRQDIYQNFLKDIKEKDMVIVASASFEDYILPFVKKYGDKAILVATRTEKANGIVTGKFVGKNCSKWEKVKRIIEIVDLSNAFVSVYTDGFHDKPLISIGNEVHLVKK